MKTAITQIIVWGLFCTSGLFSCACDCDSAPTGNRTTEPPTQRGTAPKPVEDSEITKAKQLVDSAYVLKKTGKNGAALSLFETAHHIFSAKKGKNSFEIASILDDQASVRMRLGDYDRATEQYAEAKKILGTLEGSNPLAHRLLTGIEFRLSLLGALKKHKVICSEPAEPEPSPDAGNSTAGAQAAGALPYFPKSDDMHRELGKLNAAVVGCMKGKPTPILVRTVITGQGKVVFAKVTGPKQGSGAAKCIEEGIIKAAATADLPKFGACFRPFNYLFKVGKR